MAMRSWKSKSNEIFSNQKQQSINNKSKFLDLPNFMFENNALKQHVLRKKHSLLNCVMAGFYTSTLYDLCFCIQDCVHMPDCGFYAARGLEKPIYRTFLGLISQQILCF